MRYSIKKHKGQTKPFVADFGDHLDPAEAELDDADQLTGRYRTSSYTSRTLEALKDAQEKGEVTEMLTKTFGPLIESWNLEDEGGNIVPITGEALMDVPLDILAAVTKGIQNAQRPNGKSSTD